MKKIILLLLIVAFLFPYNILDAFDIRQVGDYGPLDSVSKEKAGILIKHTEEFIEIIEKYLIKEGYEI